MLLGPENGDDKLFSSSGNNSIGDDNDGSVSESFIVSMKANDPESISDKLREQQANTTPADSEPAIPSSSIDDEFENFEFDSSISAFKPLGAPVSVPKEEAPSAPAITEPAPAEPVPEVRKPNISAETVNEIADKVPERPLFDDNDPDMLAFAGVDSTKPFENGQDLDFAGSTGSTSPFANPAPSIPSFNDDLELDEASMSINPFKAPTPSVPSFNDDVEVKPEPVAPVVEPEIPANPVPEVPASNEADSTPSNLHTYGSVKSGFNAFAKKKSPFDKTPTNDTPGEPKAPVTQDKATEAPKAPEVKPVEEKADIPAVAPIVEAKPAAPSKPEVKAETPAEPVAPVAEVKKPEPKPEPKPAVSENTAPKAPVKAPAAPIKRPSAVQAKAAETNAPINSAFAPKGRTNAQSDPTARRTPPAPSSTPKNSQATIQPVNQVNSKKRKKKEKTHKEPGKFNLLILVIVFALIIGLTFLAEQFGKSKDTARTVPTTAKETTATTEADGTTIDETTTTAATTTTEATTTTTEATEETTEATTEETTEATTEATTRRTSVEPTFSYSLKNPHTSSDGVSFDIAITNTGSENLNIADALSKFTVTVNCDSDITNISSDYFNFTVDASDDHTFYGSIRSNQIPAGETVYATIEVETASHVAHFTVNYSFE